MGQTLSSPLFHSQEDSLFSTLPPFLPHPIHSSLPSLPTPPPFLFFLLPFVLLFLYPMYFGSHFSLFLSFSFFFPLFSCRPFPSHFSGGGGDSRLLFSLPIPVPFQYALLLFLCFNFSVIPLLPNPVGEEGDCLSLFIFSFSFLLVPFLSLFILPFPFFPFSLSDLFSFPSVFSTPSLLSFVFQ